MIGYNIVVSSNESTVVAEYVTEYNSANAYQSEAQLEQQLIERLQSQGYEYISVADETMLTDNVRRQLEALNAYAFTDPVLEQLECMEL